MKTISIFAYDIDGIENFLKILNSIVKNSFNFEVYLYTAYSSMNNIGSNQVDQYAIDLIKSYKSKFNHINSIAVYGLISSGEESAPETDNYTQLSDWIIQHIDNLELDGIVLDYEFPNLEHKKRYTGFARVVDKELTALDKKLNVSLGCFSSGAIKHTKLRSTTLINMGTANNMYNFNRELLAMFSSPIGHDNKVPVISFTAHGLQNSKKISRLLACGYNRIGIFDPMVNHDQYLRNLIDFIDTKSSNKLYLPGLFAIINGILLISILTAIFMILNIGTVYQLYTFSGLTILSIGSNISFCCRTKTMLSWMWMIFACIVMIGSLGVGSYQYYTQYCTGNIINISCNNSLALQDTGVQAVINWFDDVELSNISAAPAPSPGMR